MTSMQHRLISARRCAGTAAAMIGMIAAAACSSSSGSPSSGNTATAAGEASNAGNASTAAASTCMSKATSFLQPYDSLPTTLASQYTPLKSKPAPGTIIRLVGPIPTDNDSARAQQVAAKAVGWTAKSISYNGSIEDLNAKFEQAISEKPTVITVSGQPASGILQSINDAKAAGIIVSLDNILDQPTGYPGFAAVSSSTPTAQTIGKLNAYMFMRDSNCAGDVAVFDLPFPILQTEVKTFADTVKADCPRCKVSLNDLQVSQIATPAGTSAIVSKVQSSPSTKYVYAVISDVATGLPSALAAAGVSGVKIFGSVPDANALLALRNKQVLWWVDQSAIINGWTELDAALRAIETKGLVQDPGGYPLAVLTPRNVGSSDDPTYPSDYQAEFTKLWAGIG
jgi:ABC-type sugar transport system substrate-binding protein